VAWLAPDRRQEVRSLLCLSKAPEICIAVLSPSNTPDEITEKIALYFETGVQEVWISDHGTLQFHFPGIPSIRPSSGLCPTFPPQIDLWSRIASSLASQSRTEEIAQKVSKDTNTENGGNTEASLNQPPLAARILIASVDDWKMRFDKKIREWSSIFDVSPMPSKFGRRGRTTTQEGHDRDQPFIWLRERTGLNETEERTSTVTDNLDVTGGSVNVSKCRRRLSFHPSKDSLPSI
jgi:hypothetical protein